MYTAMAAGEELVTDQKKSAMTVNGIVHLATAAVLVEMHAWSLIFTAVVGFSTGFGTVRL